MAKHPIPGGKKVLSRKIAVVRQEKPSLTSEAATGKAAGILRHEAAKKRRGKR